MEHTIQQGSSQAVISDRGGTVLSFTNNGVPIFYPLKTYGEKARGGCPICLPWFGSSIVGPKKHGYLRDTLSCECNADRYSVSQGFSLVPTATYPWNLFCTTRASIYGSMLELSVEVERRRDGLLQAAPILPAFHPYLAFPARGVEVLVDDESITGFSAEARAIPFRGGQSEIALETPQGFIVVVLESSLDGWDDRRKGQIVLWSDSPDEYVCVEPVFGEKELFNTPDGIFLDVGKQLTFSMSIIM